MILIVDDNPDIRHLLQVMLRSDGYDSVTAEHGSGALSCLESHSNIRCVILDLGMPGMSGWDVLKAIRTDSKYGQPKVIVFTADGGAMKEKALAAGADGYVVKGSLDWINIVDEVERWCDRGSSTPSPRDLPDRDVC